MLRWFTIALAVLGLALVGAGCGGGEDEASDDADITIMTETETDDSDGSETDEEMETETETDDGTGSVGTPTEECLAAVTAFAALSQAVGTAGSGGDAGDSAELFGEFADNAPEEIQDDIRVLADAYREYIQELSDLGLQSGETPSAEQIQQLTEASAKLNTAEITEASQNFSTWASTNCPS